MRHRLHPIDTGFVTAGLALLPGRMDSLEARAQIHKIGLQESNYTERRQLVGWPPRPTGPAVSFYQFERGGISALLTHRATRQHLRELCDHFGIHANTSAIWEALKTNDVLAAAMARLNLWWAPQRLPDIHDSEESWHYYLNCWRPGAVKRDYAGLRAKWETNHQEVVDYLLTRP